MSIILKKNNKIFIYTKGADIQILNRLKTYEA